MPRTAAAPPHHQGDLDRGRRSTSTAPARPTISTGIPFYDHMLDQLGRHGGFDLTRAGGRRSAHRHAPHGRGRRDRRRRGVRRGARRQGRRPPVRERPVPARRGAVDVALDLSGRPQVEWHVPMPEALPLGDPAFDPQLAEHAVASFATAANITLHVELVRGRNVHHIIEATFKGLAALVARRGARRRRRWRAVDQGCAVRACRTAADRRARLRHRQPALGAEGARTRGGRRPPHRRPRPDRRRRRRRAARRGAFGACMDALRAAGLERPRTTRSASGRPFLGICVGMQMLFTKSRGERGRGRARRDPRHGHVDPAGPKIPQMQWNRLDSSTRTSRCCATSATSRRCTSCTRCTACPTTRRGRGHGRVRHHVQRRVPARQRVRHAVPPREVEPTRACGCCATSSRCAAR